MGLKLTSSLCDITIFSTDKKTRFGPKSLMSLTLQHNRKTFLTNHKTAYPDLAAYHYHYHIYMHVLLARLLALSPKMAPISHFQKQLETVRAQYP